MTKGFDQQDPSTNFSFPKSAPKPQHGQAFDQKTEKVKEQRSFQPRPGH
ncbi:MAG: hypothetical protein KA085_05805 [Phenylobacterium sp.]|jgi:hypothetical protein|nr:hypothetical protein [Phenylobacterium sp.]MBP7648864.1 hypothetical protein [Phenylobacterium sp.]MBP7815620.1 hypothetical protein [Phenylobacterium sp.]MBP9755634.1 hypothetical protein [Phenylobacterium sp.]